MALSLSVELEDKFAIIEMLQSHPWICNSVMGDYHNRSRQLHHSIMDDHYNRSRQLRLSIPCAMGNWCDG